ncbi:FecR domain-containing protein [Acinetobacter corruptisaponis]|uniref:FecR domain-containing protein n=1 Tax=Acinetobacter corruptisaponis TaxID=3045147 RepID=A0ABY8S9R6_9GAMM|nr:FecR domain-containing protein [Acinetobacter sp. KCTC 92772]WHP07252.1 FecR domain-containing protein [Acinetobacter sp. KCTC 92772]
MPSVNKQQVLAEASTWLMRLQESELSLEELEQLQQWQQQSPLHQKIWQKALLLQTKFSDVPLDITIPVMQKVRHSSTQSYKKYLWLLAFLPLCSGLYLASEQQQWLADYRSGVGERKRVVLPDGGMVLLNASSAIDVEYTDRQRTVVLRKGEIWIETQHDPLKRPFFVSTQQGTVQALGTKYLVKMMPEYSQVAVTQGRVQVSPHQSQQQQIIETQQQLSFDARHISKVRPFEEGNIAWTKGFLMVNEMTLKDFAERLQTYQKGMIRVDSEIENIKISGSYPIDDLEKVYAMLVQTYGLEIERYAGGYWTVVQQAK